MPPKPSPASGMVDIIITGDAESIQAATMSISWALSAAVLGGFLKSVVVPYLQERAEERFLTEGDDVVGQWSPLAPATVHIRESQGFPGPHPINVRTGSLEDYITNDPGLVSANALGATLTWPGTDAQGELLNKVSVAQMGGHAPNAMQPTPARPVIGVNEEDLLFVLAGLSMLLAGPAGLGNVMSVEGGRL